ncbi:SpoIID/LytB domain-containing protein [Candidatus Avelusimicrobium aviculae]|uniref:SpoIID/LytB domain-containing protein n=1 Tax=Candidatus Avelusimicrobium aviculae TaxID=3416206 RepID=UPI003D11E063
MGLGYKIKTFCVFTASFLLFAAATHAAPADTENNDAQTQLKEAADLYFSYKPKESLEKYLEISKQTHDKDAFLNAAFIAMELGSPKQAVDIMSAAHKYYPNDETITEFMAEAYLADGQYSAAEMLLSLLVSKPGRAEFLYINLARAQMGMGEDKLALYNLQTAAKGKNHRALSNYLLGLLYEKEKNYQKAAQHFKKASTYDHQALEAKEHYAAALAKLGDYNEAYRQYRMIYSLEKNLPSVNKAMADLRPRLTKSEKELTPTKELTQHTFIKKFIVPPQDAQEIRIGLGTRSSGRPSARKTVKFSPSHDFTVKELAGGKKLLRGKAKEEWTAELKDGKPFLLSPSGKKYPFKKGVRVTVDVPSGEDAPTIIVRALMSGAGMTWASVDDKEYRGDLEILHNTSLNALVPVNVLMLEEYLEGVISSEMPIPFPINALRAQAVLARTYALKHMGKHNAYGYDLCDTQNCQVYKGVSAESERGNASVESTMGEIMVYNKKPIEAVFSANCGGITQSAKEAGWFEHVYLHPVSDYKDFDFDHLQPYHFKDLLQHAHDAYSRYDKNVSLAAYRWTRVVEEEDLRQVIRRKRRKDIGSITAIIPLRRGRSGYVNRVQVKGTKGSVILNKENVIRGNLGPGMLRSSYFIVQPNYENKKLKNFVFYGGGWGHGVGFCQTGAAGRAEAGQDYKTILYHYFPQAKLNKDK